MHPVSRSIVEISRDINFDRDYQVTEHVGKGLIGNKGGMEIIVGNYKWLSSLGYEVNDKYDVDGCSSWVIKDKKVLGCLVFRDVPRDDAPKMICDLADLGIEDTRLLTGDNEVSAERIRNAVGIKKMYCRLLPEQKLEMVRRVMKEKIVAFVGDGINDALALAEADVGIAMGAMGSDTAIQSADISLMNNNLDNISFAIRLARKTRRIIYQNIVIAFTVSFVMITLAAAGVIGALLGAVLHNLGAFVILINSGRIIKLK
jgi:Cd2+/Zn2+-exporting ATPase/Cu+-exporting ATPase